MNTNYYSGIGFFGLLTIAFIVLKLCGIINWSWFFVLLPIIVPTIIVLPIVIIYLILIIIVLKKK